MSARDDYPGFAWRADVTPDDAEPDDIGHQCRRALDEIDRLREVSAQLACALEAVLDNEHYDYGLQVSDADIAEANAALDARLAYIDRFTP